MAVLMRQMLGSVAQFERAMIRERQREGIALAKAAGKYKGSKGKLTEEQAAALVAKDKENGGKNRSALAREFGVSRETLYQYLIEAGRHQRAAGSTVTGGALGASEYPFLATACGPVRAGCAGRFIPAKPLETRASAGFRPFWG